MRVVNLGEVAERCAASMAGHYENCRGQIERNSWEPREREYSKKGEGEGRIEGKKVPTSLK
jgi:hypothetical protein